MSRRRKLTPEIIAKTFSLSFFAASVGFATYNLIGLLQSQAAFASSTATPPMPKTLSDITEPSVENYDLTYKPNGPTYPYIRGFYNSATPLLSDSADSSSQNYEHSLASASRPGACPRSSASETECCDSDDCESRTSEEDGVAELSSPDDSETML
ncbi:hypothetical protein IJ095_02890 [Candidatus Saccharibacteria bacterium]|nr:hypothetical protein [Candidatus Saccharibacteria bacterium]